MYIFFRSPIQKKRAKNIIIYVYIAAAPLNTISCTNSIRCGGVCVRIVSGEIKLDKQEFSFWTRKNPKTTKTDIVYKFQAKCKMCMPKMVWRETKWVTEWVNESEWEKNYLIYLPPDVWCCFFLDDFFCCCNNFPFWPTKHSFRYRLFVAFLIILFFFLSAFGLASHMQPDSKSTIKQDPWFASIFEKNLRSKHIQPIRNRMRNKRTNEKDAAKGMKSSEK